MVDKCEICGGDLIKGQLAGMHGICFYPAGELKKLKPKYSTVECSCCQTCGHIQGFTAVNHEKLV